MNTATQTISNSENSGTHYQLIPFNRLIKSKENIRKVSPDKAADKALIANIKLEGLLSSLVVRESKSRPGYFEVIGGERRWGSLDYLIEKNCFPEDYLTPCTIKNKGSAAATSLAENLHAPTHVYDQFMAYQQMLRDGMTETEIAAHFNLKVTQVKKYLELAKVHPIICKAFSKDKITLDAVMAFTVAPSPKAQLAVYKMLGIDRCYPHYIRDALTEESISSDSALARFVGLTTYQNAGGGLLIDMFQDEKHLTNHTLLVELAEKKLASNAKKLKKDGWKNIKIQLNDINWHELHQVKPERVDVPDELTNLLENTTKQLNVMDESDEEWTDAFEEQHTLLEKTIAELEAQQDSYRQYSDEDKQRYHCIVTVGDNGKARIERGLLLRSEMTSDNSAKKSSAKSKNELSQALLTELGDYRQQIVQTSLAKNPKIASDVLLYTLCLQVFSQCQYGDRLVAIDTKCHIKQTPSMKETSTYRQLNDWVGKLSTDWLAKKTPKAKFEALQTLSNAQKQRLLAYCVAQSFDIGLSSQNDNPLQEIIVEALSIDFTTAWRPTADNYFKRLSKESLLKLGRKLISKTWASNHANNKKGDLVTALHGFFNNPPESYFNKEQLAMRETWMPEGFITKTRRK